MAPPLALGVLAALLCLATPASSRLYGLELAAADVSWRVCRTGFADPMFPGVCPQSSLHNPLHIAVTVSATWWAAPTLIGPQGPGRWNVDAQPMQRHVMLPAESGALARSIGWKAVDGTMTVVPPNAASGEAYAFAVTHAEKLSTKTNTSLHHVSTRLSFMVALPNAGHFDVEFTGCCRWADIANMDQRNYPHHVPWHVSARIAASTDSALAPSFSPRLSMPVTPVVLWNAERVAFRVFADYGGALVSLVDDLDISGRYLETPNKMSLDSSVYVTTDTRYAAFVREDGQKSILWFQAPETGKNQFAASGAWTSGPGWVVVRGDVRSLVGKKPSALPGRPVLEGLGALWPSVAFYDELQYLGPSYLGGGVVQLASKKTRALVEYEHVVKLQAFMPHDAMLPSAMASPGAPVFELGTMASPAFVPEGTMVDPHEGMLILPPGAYKGLCQTTRFRAPKLQVCAMALPVKMSVAVAEMHVSVGLDFWVQVLEPKTMTALYSSYIANLESTPGYVPYPLNPLPRLVFPQDTKAGNEGMSLYSSADKPLQIACDTKQVVTMQVAHVPTVAGLSVNRVGPPTTSDPLVWLKAVPLAEVQTNAASRIPTSLLDALSSAWHSSDAWDKKHVAVNGTQVEVTLAPQCSRSGSTGLQMVCLQVSYALDDVCMDAPAGPCLHPSNYGCHLENPNTGGRCYAMSAPSRCLYYTVTNPAATVMPRHTVPPVPQATPPPPPPPPPPSQPVIEAVEEDPPTSAAESHITHVLDLPAHLEDPHVQIARGELGMYFVEDIAMLKTGKPPIDTLRSSFDSQVTSCLCAGARDLDLQRKLLDQWNKNYNNLDSPTRAVWYRMGKELEGATVSLDEASYKWMCIAKVRMEVKKALTREITTADPQELCVMCWHATKNSAC